MNSPLNQEFEFLKKTGRPAIFGSDEGLYPFFTSSQELTKRTDIADCEGPALVFGTGGSASLHYIEGPFSATNDCYVAVPKNECVEDAQFFYYYLKINIHLIESGFRGAGLRHVSKKHLEAIELPTNPSIDRAKVINLLGKADDIRRKWKQTLAMAGNILESAYTRIVGRENPYYSSWKPFFIEQLAEDRKGSIRSGPFGSALRHGEFVDDGIAVLGIDNAVQNKFSWAGRRFITKEKYEQLRRYKVFPNDVIITIMGTTGRSAVVPEDIPEAITTKHLATITCNTELIHPMVLSFAIHSDPTVIRQIKARNKGAIMDGLNLGIIRKLEINLPPMEEQLRFVLILKKTQAMQDLLANSDAYGTELFNCLSQRAFRGEL